jgi:hypothetical protein
MYERSVLTHVGSPDGLARYLCVMFEDFLAVLLRIWVFRDVTQAGAHTKCFLEGGGGADWGYIWFMFDFKNYVIKIML